MGSPRKRGATQMKVGITIVVIFLVLLILYGFPTRKRMERAYIPREGPTVWARLRDAFRARRRRRMRRRRHLRRL